MKFFRYLAFYALCCLISLPAHGKYTELFSYNVHQLNTELGPLFDLENYIAERPGVTYAILVKENHPMLNTLDLVSHSMGMGGIYEAEEVLGVPSFLWGCVLGVTGVLVVYLLTEDMDETKKAAKGMFISLAANLAIVVGFYTVYFLVFGTYLFAYSGYY